MADSPIQSYPDVSTSSNTKVFALNPGDEIGWVDYPEDAATEAYVDGAVSDHDDSALAHGGVEGRMDTAETNITNNAAAIDGVDDAVDQRAPGVGGTTGQVWGKVSNTDYDAAWIDQSDSDAVDSVNGQTGSVVLDADDISDVGTANHFMDDTQLANVNALGTASTQDVGDFATAAQGSLADTALQDVSVPSDIDATGTAGSTTFLRGDGAWATPVAVIPVEHGLTASAARPSGAAMVSWLGSVAPDNAESFDEWRDGGAVYTKRAEMWLPASKVTAVLASDSFDRTNTAGGTLGSTDSEYGGPISAWTVVGTMQISSNQVASLAGGGIGTALTAGSATDAEVSAVVSVLPAGGGVVGVTGRATATNNRYVVFVSSAGLLTLAKYVSGSYTGLDSSASAVTAGDRIGLRMVGDQISSTVNGVAVDTVTDTSHTGAGAFGLFRSTLDTAWRVNDFVAAVPVGA